MRNKNINKQTDGRRNLLGVPAFVKASQKHEITFISFAQLNNNDGLLIHLAASNNALGTITLVEKIERTRDFLS